MPLQATSGAASYDAFGGGVPFEPTYIESCFATHLYTGNGSTQTINNGIDLAGKGGMTWIKSRSQAYTSRVFDTVRGATKFLVTSSTAAEDTNASTLTAFTSSGFSVGASTAVGENGTTYASWTFREQPKFFDVVTYTGNSNNSRQVFHGLQSEPGMIVVKNTTTGSTDWMVYHRSRSGGDRMLVLNSTAAEATYGNASINDATSTYFRVDGSLALNQSGNTYVAYLFAHNAGGFGLSGTDNVISCGSFTTDGSGNATVNLGYEPQWVMVKQTNAAQNWYIEDNMRAFNLTSRAILFPNLSNAEATGASAYLAPNATGFSAVNGQLSASGTYIYIAIRRGPMRTPTTGTSVYNGIARSGTGAAATVTGAGFPPDLVIGKGRNSGATTSAAFTDKLRGVRRELYSTSTSAEVASGTSLGAVNAFTMDGFNLDADTGGGYYNWSAGTYINWCLRRAPGFFDEVCYTGTGVARTVAHNLAAVPELMIVKQRSDIAPWAVFDSTNGPTKWLELQSTRATTASTQPWNNTAPTSSVFTVGVSNSTNGSGQAFVAYLFASCPGVSKVGSYTGNGSSQTINCGFTSGARFVMIKRTDSTGDWFVWDSARGINAGNDPSLALNTTFAEVVDWNSVNADSTGFVAVQNAYSTINTSGGTYIFLAIA